MIEFLEGERIDNYTAKIIKGTFMSKFVSSKCTNGILLWNMFTITPKLISFEQARELYIPNSNKLIFFLERQDILYRTTYKDICRYVEQLEPWEEIDGYIFDDSYNWVVAITHEDNKVLTIGI